MPSRRQNRKEVSVRGLTHARLKIYCETRGLTISGFIEQLANEALDAKGVPRVEAKDVVFPRRKRNEMQPPKIGSGVHEF